MMKKRFQVIFPLLRTLGFFVLLFLFMRLLFVMNNFSTVVEDSNFGFLGALVHSLRLDLATFCYLISLPYLVYLLAYFSKSRILLWIVKFLFCLITLSVVLIHVGELCVYPEWNHKLSARVFNHLSHLDEVGRTAGYGFTLLFLLYTLIVGFVAWLLIKTLKLNELPLRASGWKGILEGALGIVLIPFLFLGARGGWQQIPINIDAAYFSQHAVLNDLSVNSTYFFGKNYLLFKRGNLDKDLPDINEEQANGFVASLYAEQGETPKILNNEKPNIVFIILESWSSNAIGVLGGNPAVTPNFDALSKEGLLFTNLYSTATTSENGNASIFAGYSCVPEISITMRPDKHRKMKTINQLLPEYHSSYLFGGDLKYGNIGSFFSEHDFDEVQDEKSFNAAIPRGKLSVHDEDLYKVWLQKLNKSSQPFLACAFTGSSHAPYDHPKRANQKVIGTEKDFMNSLVYSDEELGKFLRACKKQAWYKNTLFVIVADHGHATPMEENPVHSAYFKVPLLFYGDVLKSEYRGQRNEVVGSQSDIATTLLTQLNRKTTDFLWSKNLLASKVQDFAFHSIVRGYGWVREKGSLCYSMDYKRNLDETIKAPLLMEQQLEAQRYFLTLYKYYNQL